MRFFGYLVIFAFAPQGTPQALADMRQTISALCNYLLLPSLGLALVSGLLSMVVHKAFMEHRWVWAKAVLETKPVRGDAGGDPRQGSVGERGGRQDCGWQRRCRDALQHCRE